MRKLTRRFITNSIDGLNVSSPIRYERYYINDKLRIQKKDNDYQKEILDDSNNVIEKSSISYEEFLKLKEDSYSKIVRDSYLYLDDTRVSIKKYLDMYEGLYRIEVKFTTLEEQNNYIKEDWMGSEITDTKLAFDKYLSNLNKDEFKEELSKYI